VGEQGHHQRLFLTSKGLSDYQDRASMEPSQKKCSHPGLLVVQPEVWWLVFYLLLSKAWGLAVLQIRAALIINPTAFVPNSRVGLALPALNPVLTSLPY